MQAYDRSIRERKEARVKSRATTADLGLLYLRVTASLLVLVVHGLPKAMHYASRAAAIEDPFHRAEPCRWPSRFSRKSSVRR